MARRRSKVLKVTCGLFLGLGLLGSAWGQGIEPKEYNIAAQPLESALRQIADAQNLQLVYDPKDIRGLNTRGVRGRLSQKEALDELVEGTGIAVSIGERGSVILKPVRDSRSRPPASPQGSVEAPTMLAQATTQRPGTAPDAATSAPPPGGTRPTAQAQERIMVTAQKRNERQLDVPMSIVAIGSEELAKRRVSSLDDLEIAVPGLAVETTGWQRRIQLRGIGNNQGLFSLIGLYLDEAAVTTTGVAQLTLNAYDLERVEVLRGPQGTLYGEGSAGGTIRFITRKPELDRVEMAADVAAAFTKDGSATQRLSGVLNVPLVANTLGLRIAATSDHVGGWIDQPAIGAEDINDTDLYDIRTKLLWKPTRDTSVIASVVVHRSDGSTGTAEDENGNFTQYLGFRTSPKVRDKYEIYDLTVTHDFPAFSALNTLSYVDQDRKSEQFGFIFPSNPGVPVSNLYYLPYNPVNEVLTNEFRLTSRGSGPLQWTAGAIYRRAELDLFSNFYFAVPGPTPPANLIASNSHTLSRSWAIFGDASYQVTPQITLGAGVRRFEDDQEFGTTTLQKGTFSTTNPRLYARYQPNDNLNFYASAAKGFRSGGFNALNQPPYEPEQVRTFELGVKWQRADRSLTGEAAIFRSEYDDFQVVGISPPPDPPLNITRNAGTAEINGIDLQVVWRPTPAWMLAFNGEYLDGEFTRIDALNTPFIPGDRVPLVPKYQYSASVEREFHLAGRPGFARLDYTVRGPEEVRNRSIGTLYQGKSDVIRLLNFNAMVQWTDHFSVGFFGQNLTNDRGLVDPYVFILNASRVPPRTLGVQLNAAF